MNRTALGFVLGVCVILFAGAGASNISSLLGLSDVSDSTPTTGNVLRADGTGWASAQLSTDDLSEGSNQFLTDERIDDRVDGLIQNGTGLSWSYNDGANTLTGDVSLSPFSTTSLGEGANLYHTSERVDDRVNGLFQSGTGLSWSYNDPANTFTGNVSLSPFSTTDLGEGSNLYFTDERVDDRANGLLIGGTGISLSYNDGANTLTIDADNNGTVTSVGLSMPAEFGVSSSPVTSSGTLGVAWSPQSANLVLAGPSSGGANTPNFRQLSTDELTEGSNQFHTSERVDDRVDALLTEGDGIDLTYDDGANTLTVATTTDTGLTQCTSGAFYDLTTTMALLNMDTGSDPTISIGPGEYHIFAQTYISANGSSSDDAIDIELYNSTDAAVLSGSALSDTLWASSIPSHAVVMQVSTTYTISSGTKTIQLRGKNLIANRGRALGAYTRIGYVKLR